MLKVSADQLPREHQYNGIDVIKLLCAFFVCIIHIKPFKTDFFGLNHLYFWLQNYLCRIAVPFYFTASGFLLFRKMEYQNIDNDRIKNYCFKILRLLGIWTFLLFVGGSGQLWYLGALVLAVIVLSYFLKKGIRIHYILIISVIAFIIGLLGDSYYGFIEPLKSFFIPKVIIVGYETIFSTTRNGIFFGLIFVLMGALFSQKRIQMNNIIAIIGFIISMIVMFFEIYLLRHFSHPKDYNMIISLIPAVFFLFYLATHLNFKDKTLFASLRTIGMIVFFSHLFVNYFVELALEIAKNKMGINLFAFQFFFTILFTLIFAIVIERLSKKEKFCWIKYLYS